LRVQAKPADASFLSRLMNDDMCASVARHPSRFVAMGTLPMQAPELAAEVSDSVNTFASFNHRLQ
jgi:predicted TIM-barrel fold metal-dependent hydrolase